MKISKIQRGLVLVTLTAGFFAAGCELIVDFDRTKIPVDVNEASLPDVNIPDPDAEPADDDAGDADAADPTPDAEPDADAGELDDDAGDADAS